MLTDRRVRGAPDGTYPDGNRLYLRVRRAARAWLFRSQKGSKDSWITLGHYPQMSLLEARNKAAEHTGVSLTVQAAFEQYEKLLARDYRQPGHTTDRFHRDILPELGSVQLSRVTRAQVSGLLQKIVERGSPISANRTLTDVKRFFAVCVERGWLNSSPAEAITRRVVGGKERSRERNLGEDELVALMKVLFTPRFALPTRVALGLILLTGQRPSEVLGIHKSEIHGSWWHLPAERTKPRREQKVYLSPQARALLRFANREFGPKPFTSKHIALSQAVARMKFDPPFTPHDLRRTMATRLADRGVLPHVVEKMLNHRMDGVMQVYNRAEYLTERRDAWRLWGRWLAQLRRKAREETGNTTAVGGVRNPGIFSATGMGYDQLGARDGALRGPGGIC